MTKQTHFGVHDSQGSAETLVRRVGITNYHLIALPKSVDVHWSYCVQRQCRFLRNSV